MGQTTKYHIRYPERSGIPAGPDQMQTVAEDVEAALNTLPAWVSAASGPAYSAPGAAPLVNPRLYAIHSLPTLNQFGQVSIETPFLNGIVTAQVGPGDITNFKGFAGPYTYDNNGAGGKCRAFFRFADMAGNYLGAVPMRFHAMIVGW